MADDVELEAWLNSEDRKLSFFRKMDNATHRTSIEDRGGTWHIAG